MGLFQILYLDKVPQSAAVDESVKLAKKYGHAGTAGLVNAVLRNAKRESLLTDIDSLAEDCADNLAAKYSHPPWLVELLIGDWGKETAVRMLKCNNAIPPLAARVNTLKTTRENLLKELDREGVRAVSVPNCDEAIELLTGVNPAELDAHRRGLFYLQDVSSVLAARCLEPKPFHKVLDVCAAPGGKTTHIAALMENRGTLFALDVHDHRLALINQNAQRLGVTIIEARKQDATGNLALDYGGMDRVIADVPCSGLGVIRRRIDLKWRLRPQQIERLVRLQSSVLERAAECVGQGGILLYCTCTVTRRENADVVADFLERHPEFAPASEWPAPLRHYAGTEGFVQILPGDENMDGFFIARLRRL